MFVKGSQDDWLEPQPAMNSTASAKPLPCGVPRMMTHARLSQIDRLDLHSPVHAAQHPRASARGPAFACERILVDTEVERLHLVHVVVEAGERESAQLLRRRHGGFQDVNTRGVVPAFGDGVLHVTGGKGSGWEAGNGGRQDEVAGIDPRG